MKKTTLMMNYKNAQDKKRPNNQKTPFADEQLPVY